MQISCDNRRLCVTLIGGLHKLRQQARGRGGPGGLAKCLCYYISLCSKVADGGGRGVKNWQNLADIETDA